MKILIVEDDPTVASVLTALISSVGRYTIVGIAEDFDSALEIAEETQPDLAFVDIQLSALSSGYAVADELGKRGISCVFSTGTPPPFAVPELAIGCLVKPYGLEEVQAILSAAREKLEKPDLPGGLEIYAGALDLAEMANEDAGSMANGTRRRPRASTV